MPFLRYQFLGENVVNCCSLTLTVGAIQAVIAFNGGAFIKIDVVVLQRVDQYFHSAGTLTLGVSVFHPQEQNAAALVGHPLGDHTLNQIAQMDKTGRGRSHTGHDGAFGQFTLGKTCLDFLGRFGHIRKKQISKCLIIHKYYLYLHDFVLYNIASRGGNVNFNIAFLFAVW